MSTRRGLTKATGAACALLVVALLALAPGCVELPDFARASRVEGPRVLAVFAEPPEANPGQPIDLSVLVAGVDDGAYEVSWRACAAFAQAPGSSQFGDRPDDEGCGGALSFALGKGSTLSVPGEVTARLAQDLDLIAVSLGSELPPEIIDAIRTRVGIPFMVEARVQAEGKLIRSVKRVLISERQSPHANPPPPRFRIGDTEVRAESGVLAPCVTDSGRAPAVAVDSEVELSPVVEGDEEPWVEDYEVLDARGDVQPRTERAYYSWFSTRGRLEQEVTKSPLRNELWRTPKNSGCYPLWLVVRDGHGGASACQTDVAVGDEGACD